MSPKRKGSTAVVQTAPKRARKATNVHTGPPRRSNRQKGTSPEVAARDDVDSIRRRDSVHRQRCKSKSTTIAMNPSASIETQAPHSTAAVIDAAQAAINAHEQSKYDAVVAQTDRADPAAIKDPSMVPAESQAKHAGKAIINNHFHQAIDHDHALSQDSAENPPAHEAIDEKIDVQDVQVPPIGIHLTIQGYQLVEYPPQQSSENVVANSEPHELTRHDALPTAYHNTYTVVSQDPQDPATPTAEGQNVLKRFIDAAIDYEEDAPFLSKEAKAGRTATAEVDKLIETSQIAASELGNHTSPTPKPLQPDETQLSEQPLSQAGPDNLEEDAASQIAAPDVQSSASASLDVNTPVTESQLPSDISIPHDLEDDPDLFGDDLEPLSSEGSPIWPVVDAQPPAPAQPPFALGPSIMPPKPRPEEEEFEEIMPFRPEDQFNAARRQIAGQAGRTIREYCDSFVKDKLIPEARKMVRDGRVEEECDVQEFIDDQHAKQGKYMQTWMVSPILPAEPASKVDLFPQLDVPEDPLPKDGQTEAMKRAAQSMDTGEP